MKRDVMGATIARVTRLRWIAAMLSMVAAAGCGGGSDDAAPVASETVTTTADATAVELPSSPPPEELRPGQVTTTVDFPGPAVTFTVPAGWYGFEGDAGFAIGKGHDPSAQEFVSGGLFVDLLDLPLAEATSRFEKIEGIEVESVRQIRIGGYPARRYDVEVRAQVLLEALGAPVDLRRGSLGPIFMNVRGQTLLIRWESADSQDEIEKVLMSFMFPR